MNNNLSILNGVSWSSILANGNASGANNPSINAGQVLQWSTDTGLSRLAAGSAALGNGTNGDTSGTLTLTTLTMKGLLNQYNSINTQGNGVLACHQSGRLVGQTTAQNILSFTTPSSDTTYLVTFDVLVTSYTSGTMNVRITYTDESNTSRNFPLNMNGPASALKDINSATLWGGIPITIRAKASTTLTIATSGTFTLTYNADAFVHVE